MNDATPLMVDGARVRMRGKPTFWAPRGKLQFVADRVELAGKGALLLALEKLKAKLAAEGLFANERKRRLPPEPRVIGVVTSALPNKAKAKPAAKAKPVAKAKPTRRPAARASTSRSARSRTPRRRPA